MKHIQIVDVTPRPDLYSDSVASWSVVAAFSSRYSQPVMSSAVGVTLLPSQMAKLEAAAKGVGTGIVGKVIGIESDCLDVKPCLENLLGLVAPDPAFMPVR